ncbi:hypothetical protein OEW28_06815 [Defluviimonas sp. WL0002]|uniref:Phytanoyl-CoA dioxygenase (PhyH) n=1 Tax=Albidovulum marisflavi TaxID=2984159 RepID=A0ABT2ZB84_9RHOB|nr:hypothetical protein [Defluviimonas sp. WL0002]MCV2868337.1 hypothetical protein [Defluviimonas sp. WL0002]
MVSALASAGWLRFPAEASTLAWASAALPHAMAAVSSPDADWRSGGTWLVGLEALPNARDGSVDSVPFVGAAARAVGTTFGPPVWHRAQLSVTWPGYPRPSAGESETAFGYRLRRDAAHVDGLLAIGPDRRRMLKEPHAFILGIGLNDSEAGAAPLAVWEGSHHIVARAFRSALSGLPAEAWGDVDLTECYQAARREIFATCARHLVPLRAGEAVLMHRMLLHGISPWAEGAIAPPEGRATAYVRPLLNSVEEWMGPS